MSESNSFLSVNNNDELKKWIYPMFFSTKSGPPRIQIVNSVNIEPKNIRTIAEETKMSYFHVKYNVDLLERKKFLIRIKKKYVISEKFRETNYILDNITNQTNNWNQ